MTKAPTETYQTIHQRAEEKARLDEKALLKTLPLEDAQQLFHDLRVHQIELEMQNEELRRTQHELEVSRARYFKLYDLAPIGYLTLSEPGLIQEANLTVAAMLGVERNSLFNNPISRWIYREDQDIYYQHRKKVFEVNEIQTWAMRMVRADGSPFWARLQAVPAHNGEYWITLTDINEIKQAEVALAKSEQRFSIFMENIPLGVYIKDGLGRVLFANRYLHDLLGVENLIGKTPEELLPSETVARMIADDQKAITEGLVLRQETVSDAFGEERILDYYKFPINLPDGATLLGGICLDITARRQAEEALVLKQQQLDDINQSLETRINMAVAEMRMKDEILIQQGRLAAMGEMINNIAHQWRQPLNSLGLIVQSMKFFYEVGELTAEEMDKAVASAMGVIMHMSGTIDDFRNFFSTEKEPRAFCVNQVVSRALNFVSPELKSIGINVTLDEQPDIPATGYPNEYLQTLLNIITNAKDALIELKVADPLISIRIFREMDRSIVTIRDNAGGISEDVLHKIFDPYFTTKGHGKGTGIGLYMSKSIIEKNMGGRLSACNVNGGAEFRIEV